MSANMFAMEDGINGAGFGRAQFKLIAITGFFQAADAMEMMMLSFLGPAVQCEWDLTSTQVSALTTVVFVGMLFGTYFWGILADRYGRWNILFIDCIFVCVFAIVSALSQSYGMLVACRGLVGFGLGGFGVTWTYFFEFIPTSHRGRWASIMMVWWSVGTVLEAGLAWLILPTLGWRWLLVISALPLLLVLLGLLLLPESPRYLLSAGKADRALEILREIARENGNFLPEGTLKPLEHEDKPGPWTVLKVILCAEKWTRLTWNLWNLWFANAFCYYGLVLMTTVLTYHRDDNICDEDKLLTDADYTNVLVSTAAELPGLFLSLLVVDRLGRKLSQAFLFAGTGIFILLLVPLNGETLADVVVLFFARMLITGAFTVTFLYTPEVYPTNIRGTAFGYANAFARFGGMVSPFVAQDLILNGHARAAELIFAAMCGLATISSIRLPIETAGRQLQDEFNKGGMEMVDVDRVNSVASDVKSSPREIENVIGDRDGGDGDEEIGLQ